ncbi:hypothetical protein NI17_003095 [Thermobifida halotolerans]|uniref:Uncharacterized protein n=1 Tax=Thermobifida halotolerans TaxID=483545 RepID=A0AA97M4M4_9ACTN|nr:hypothetical protein [Thermobifida halotolerans]UOE20246.1 hypothetical protein NI17_003095 [Thermobifida halotolerans]
MTRLAVATSLVGCCAVAMTVALVLAWESLGDLLLLDGRVYLSRGVLVGLAVAGPRCWSERGC